MRLRIALYAVLVLAVCGVLVVGIVAWLGPEDPDDPREGPVDEVLAGQLADTGLTLYLPDVRDYRPQRPQVVNGRVTVGFTAEDGEHRLTLVIQAASSLSDLCEDLHDPADECVSDGDELRFSFEEMSTAGVVRGDSALRATGMVTEADPELLDDALRALREAPRISPRDLSRVG